MTRPRFNELVYQRDEHRSITDADISPSQELSAEKKSANLSDAKARRSWACHTCDFKFYTPTDLEHHLNGPAHDASIYRCSQCEKRFKTFSNLCRHVEVEKCIKGDELANWQQRVANLLVDLTQTKT